jgi:hypothetical protein
MELDDGHPLTPPVVVAESDMSSVRRPRGVGVVAPVERDDALVRPVRAHDDEVAVETDARERDRRDLSGLTRLGSRDRSGKKHNS